MEGRVKLSVAAKLLGISLSQAKRQAYAGTLPTIVSPTGRRFVTVAWLKTQTGEATGTGARCAIYSRESSSENKSRVGFADRWLAPVRPSPRLEYCSSSRRIRERCQRISASACIGCSSSETSTCSLSSTRIASLALDSSGSRPSARSRSRSQEDRCGHQGPGDHVSATRDQSFARPCYRNEAPSR